MRLVFVVIGLAGVYAVTFVAHLAWQYFRWHRQCRAAARRLYLDASATYQGEHEYRVAVLSELPTLDLAGYERVRVALLAEGFSPLGCYENVTLSRVYPALRTMCDAYVDGDGSTVVVTYWLGGSQTVEVGSATEDGRLLSTTNGALDTGVAPPEVEKRVLPAQASPTEVVRIHRERLSAWRAREPQLRLATAKDLDTLLVITRRQSGRTSAFRRQIGLATEQEMVGFALGTAHEKTARRVWREFRRLAASRRSRVGLGNDR